MHPFLSDHLIYVPWKIYLVFIPQYKNIAMLTELNARPSNKNPAGGFLYSQTGLLMVSISMVSHLALRAGDVKYALHEKKWTPGLDIKKFLELYFVTRMRIKCSMYKMF